MDIKQLIIGYYHNDQFVYIRSKNESDELKLLGSFGHDLESAVRKDDERRGPLDRLVIDRAKNSEEAVTSVLTMHEAFYLAHALGRLQIRNKDNKTMDLNTCWTSFRNFQEGSGIGIDYAVDYAVYYYFRTRGWIVKSGANYGTNFLLYRLGPSHDHAQYALMIVHEIKGSVVQKKLDWQTIYAAFRVNQSACKELLIVYTITDVDQGLGLFFSPESIKDMKIVIENLTCKTNLIL